MSKIHNILEKYWGYPTFRPLQEDIINSLLQGNDTLALLPTGGGKSICFQVPALATSGLCIVVSPLIALMKDQVKNLDKRGIRAYAIYSGMSKKQVDIVLDNCIYGDAKFLYLSPERLETDLFRERLSKMNVGLLAVDEAHCISQWGYDFRPSYLKINALRKAIPGVPCIALTASATELVTKDILDKLNFNSSNIFRKSFARENLSYSTFETDNKKTRLLEILKGVPGTGVVYVRNRARTKSIANFLKEHGIKAEHYHAGLSSKAREQKQDLWINDKIRIIVCTNAFGMGIDKPNVRVVVHMDLPPDLESYYQEAGRAGRDEKKAYAVLLYDQNDIKYLEESISNQHPEIKLIKKTYQLLTEYLRLAEGSYSETFYPVDIDEFKTKYKLNSIKTINSIKKLSAQGIIEMSEDYGNVSQILIKTTSEGYINYQKQHKKLAPILELIIRMYGGDIFDRPVNIQESKMAHHLETNIKEVRESLKKLVQNDVIEYRENSKIPRIRFIFPVTKKLNLPNTKYLDYQKSLYESKVASMINYATHTNRCRTQLILEYFDEHGDYECGICDNCLRSKKQTKTFDHDKLKDLVIKNLEESPVSLDQLQKIIHNKDRLTTVLSELVEIGQIKFEKGIYHLVKV